MGSLVRRMGLEPTRYCYHRHLKPARLPIPPPPHKNTSVTHGNYITIETAKSQVISKFFKRFRALLLAYKKLFAIIFCVRGSVGTGRRARLRILWEQSRVGSSPIFRTDNHMRDTKRCPAFFILRFLQVPSTFQTPDRLLPGYLTRPRNQSTSGWG